MNSLFTSASLLSRLVASRGSLATRRRARRGGLHQRQLASAVIESLETRTLLSATLHLVFSSQPTTTTAGDSISSISVEIEDGSNAVDTSNNSLVTFSVNSGPGDTAGSVFFAVPAVDGVATLDGLAFTEAGAYTLAASATNISGAVSSSFNITPDVASQLVITQGPSSTMAGQTLSGINVAVEDQYGNIVTTDSSNITIGVASGSGTLLGTTTANASSGIATFSSLSIHKADTYTLAVSEDGLSGDTTGSFAISPAAANTLAYISGPQSVTAGQTISTVSVAVEDQYGNVVTTDSSNVSLSIASGSGTLLGTTTANASAGIATFSNLSITKADTYTLGAADTGVSGATSGSFTVNPDVATHLVFTTQPGSVTAGALGSISVSVEDQFGNVLTTDSSNVTMSIGSGNGNLGGTQTVAAASGVATFTNLTITKSGGYTLSAVDAELSGATSNSFTITSGTASQLAITQDTSSTIAGATLPTLVVSVEDQYGNVVTTDNSNVAVALTGAGTLNGTKTLAATSGVATFSTLSLNTTGSYALNITDGTLNPATSSTFSITPAAASKVVYATGPSSTSAGALGTLVVDVEDPFNNIVTGDTSAVTISVASGSGSLLGTVTVNAVAGVATFTDLAIHTADSYTLRAADGELTPVTSGSFTISPLSATKLAFTSQPASMIAGNLLTGINVSVEDQYSNVVTTSSAHVTFTVTGGGSTFHFVITASSGVAALTSIYLVKAGSYSVSAASSGLTGANSNTITVDPAAPFQLAITQPTGSATAGQTLPTLQATVEDQFGNVITSDASNVSVAVASGSGTLLGTATASAVNGVATFSNLSIDTADTYTLQVSDTGLQPATTASFTISPASASRLVITTQPTNTVAGQIISNVVVTVEDAFGNVITGDASNVQVAIASGTGTLLGTATVNASSGVATFSTLKIDQTGTFTLSAADGGLSGATSSSFSITPAAADHLAYLTGPASGAAGELNTVTVAVEDQFGNIATGDSSNVMLAVDTGSGSLLGNTTVNASAGIATFNNLAIETPDTYTLDATDGLLTHDVSGSFNISPAAPSQLVITQDTTTANAGQTLSAIQVSVEDPFGNVVTTDSSNIAIAIDSGNGTLLGVATANAVDGVATFSTLKIDQAGSFTLQVTEEGLTSATTASFTISPNVASKLVITQQPTDTTAGQSISATLVSVEDAFGNVVTTDSSNVTIAIGSGSGTLNGTATANASSGVASFSGLSIDQAGTFTLSASEGGVNTGTTNAFHITPDVASQLVITTGPAGGTAGALSTIRISVEDQFGNVVTTDASTVSLAITTGSGTLTGNATVAASSGVATFSTLAIDQAGTYKLSATDNLLASATTSSFTLNPGAATQLVFMQQPTNTVAGQLIPTVTVAVEDQFGNVVTTDSSNVTLGINGSTSLRLIVAASNGTASFSGAAINTAGTYKLKAIDGNLAAGLSNNFNITPDAASQLVFTTGPSSGPAGTLSTIQVSVEDQFGNVETSDNSNVTVALTSGSGTLLGTATANADGGVATFSDLSITTPGAKAISVTDGLLSPATSSTFTLAPVVASQLVITQQTSDAVAGQTLAALQVSVEDAFGNLVTGDNSNVTLTLASGSGTLLGTATANAVGGIATFSNLSLDNAGTFTLAARDGSLTGATSNSFQITPAGATHLAFTQGPNGTTAGGTISEVSVAVEDQFGNVVTTDTSNITLNLASGAGTLAGTTTVQADGGVATFDDLSIATAGTVTLGAHDSNDLNGATSSSFVITPDSASQLAITTGPAGTTSAGATLSTMVVKVEDQFGNVVNTDDSNVAVALSDDSVTLSGAATVNAVNGVATFSGLSIDTAGQYTVDFTDDSLTDAPSGTFTITPAAASQLVFAQEPASGAAGNLGTVVVDIEDQFGNLATGSSANVSISTAGTGVLSGTSTVAAVNGVATFSNLSIAKNGNYLLTASSTGLTSGTTDPFSLGAKLVFQHQPTTTVAGQTIGNPLVVLVEDSTGHVITTDNSEVEIGISSGPGGSTLDGTLVVNAVNGVATFSDLDITTAGSYKLVASDDGFSNTISNSFTISPDVPASLSIQQDTSHVVAGAKMSAIKIEVLDQFGNLTTNSRTPVVLSIGSGPNGGAITGTVSVVPANGIATFSTLAFKKAGQYTLAANDAGATPMNLTEFTVSPAAAKKLAFNQQPTTTSAGSNISPAITVDIEDTFGNIISSTANITLGIASGPSGASLSRTTAAVAGEASFGTVNLAKTGTYKLKATSAGLTAVTSVSFTITAATALPALLESL